MHYSWCGNIIACRILKAGNGPGDETIAIDLIYSTIAIDHSYCTLLHTARTWAQDSSVVIDRMAVCSLERDLEEQWTLSLP